MHALQEEPATSQLYVMCDMAVATIKALAQRMQLDAALLTAKHPGGITLPVNFYRPLDKEERGGRWMRRAALCWLCAAYCGYAAMHCSRSCRRSHRGGGG
jgi:hypothetical protein